MSNITICSKEDLHKFIKTNGIPYDKTLGVAAKDFQDLMLSSFWRFVNLVSITKENKILIPRVPLYKHICDCLDMEDKWSLILLPRRHNKTLLASLYVAYYIIKNRNKSVSIIAGTCKKSEEILYGIRRFFTENVAIVSVFGPLLSPTGNNRKKLTLLGRSTTAKESNVGVLSITQEIQSGRADFILFEDIVGDDFVDSNAVRNRIRSRYISAYSLLEDYEKARVVATGTRYTIDDIYQDIIDSNKTTNKWNIISHSVIENGKPLCSYVMNLAEIKQKQVDMPSWYFASQFMNNPINADVNIFDIDKYTVYGTEDVITYNEVYFGVDFSDGVGKDRNAVVVIGVNTDTNTIYVIDMFASNTIDVTAFYGKIREFYEIYRTKTRRVVVELNRNGRTILGQTFIRLDNEYSQRIPFDGVTNTESKYIRIEKLEPMLTRGTLVLPSKQMMKFTQLRTELSMYNRNDRNNEDDCVDAMCIAINYYLNNSYKQKARNTATPSVTVRKGNYSPTGRRRI